MFSVDGTIYLVAGFASNVARQRFSGEAEEIVDIGLVEVFCEADYMYVMNERVSSEHPQ